MDVAETILEGTEETRTDSSTGRLWAILAVVLIADMMDLLDSTLTNIAAPSIVREIGGGVSLIKWLGSSYALAMGGCSWWWEGGLVTDTDSAGCF
jgi:MFS family permease